MTFLQNKTEKNKQHLPAKLEKYKQKLHNSFDVTTKVLEKEGGEIGFLYLKSFISHQLFIDGIFFPLSRSPGKLTIEQIKNGVIKNTDVKVITEDEVIENVLKGNVVIFVKGEQEVLAVDIGFYPTRTPEEPPTSPVLQGPREGFVEDIKTNITLLRRRLCTQDLVLKSMSVGRYSNTKVVIAYLSGIASSKVIKEIEKRINQIKIDGIVDSYYILTFLQDRPDSLFKQVGNTEKPDIVAAKMLEGRVAIIVDNSPIVLTLPFILMEEMQSSNDYYSNHHYVSFVRIVRLLGIVIAILLPGAYLSLQLYHYNVLPLNFLITVADTTQGLPFTPFLELLFIVLLFQILYEVSLRLPSYLGLATSIVGALILGDTGVKSGLISPPGVIVVALAKIALYTAPEQASQITVLQFLFLLIGGSLGLLGLVGGLLYLINYLNNFDSFGTPYLAPFSPRVVSDLKDGVFKVPLTQMHQRPQSFANKNRIREGDYPLLDSSGKRPDNWGNQSDAKSEEISSITPLDEGGTP